jgi:hypothetical protein
LDKRHGNCNARDRPAAGLTVLLTGRAAHHDIVNLKFWALLLLCVCEQEFAQANNRLQIGAGIRLSFSSVFNSFHSKRWLQNCTPSNPGPKLQFGGELP